jgi:hypothetical protein
MVRKSPKKQVLNLLLQTKYEFKYEAHKPYMAGIICTYLQIFIYLHILLQIYCNNCVQESN